MVAVLGVWARPSSRCSWPGGCRGAEGEAKSRIDLASLGVQVQRRPPSIPPAAEEGGEEGVQLRLVAVHDHGAVGGVRGEGGAAPTRPILAVVTLKPRPCCGAGRVSGATREDELRTRVHPLRKPEIAKQIKMLNLKSVWISDPAANTLQTTVLFIKVVPNNHMTYVPEKDHCNNDHDNDNFLCCVNIYKQSLPAL